MKISTILDYIDNGHMALPEFQRGYVWNRDQVRGLFDSLYRGHPVGGLLVWATESKEAVHRGDAGLAPGVVKLLLDGQQRMTSIYGVVRGQAPKFFDGNARAFTDLMFHLETETFSFFQPIAMKGDPLWIDVTQLMKKGNDGLGELINDVSSVSELTAKIGGYTGRLSKVLAIRDRELHIEEVTGDDKSIDVVVDIFNRVNSGGTKLSQGDLALAKICSEWPEARDVMKNQLSSWKSAGFDFNLDWLLRSMNTVLTGEAKFQHLHSKSASEINDALKRASKQIDNCLNMISGRLGLDHNRVFFGRFAVPVMVRFLDRKSGPLSEKERDKLLFWYVQAGMWGRFSGSVESYVDKDLEALEGPHGGLDALLEQLRLWHGTLLVEPGNFGGWSLGARFYPVLYLLTRMGEACDWGTGLPLKANLLGRMNALEVHHVFPKAQLYKREFDKSEVNALANFCFLTKDTNLKISDRLPEEYFLEIEENHPGALESQWIPMDRKLWKIENYLVFLEERRKLLAHAANERLAELLHGENQWLSGQPVLQKTEQIVVGGISSQDEEQQLRSVQDWVLSLGYAKGIVEYEYADSESGEQKAVFDLAWPQGLQEGLSEPVALLLDEPAETIAYANQAGFRCFTSTEEFRHFVKEPVVPSAEF
ncbi:MAG: DUF262 domain-containing protein [Planctomycetes bacterium]|jgi:hypothetical protein|nr:DUF262 domain-containing protein [Planctomycetota bacterium]